MYAEYVKKLKALLALEYNCSPEDLEREENVVTVSALNEGRRNYSPDKPFFAMASLGGNTLITADECIRGFLCEYAENVKGHRIFEFPNLLPIDAELRKYGYKLTPTQHKFLPCKDAEPTGGYPVKWFFEREIDRFYGDGRFPNAIYPSYKPERPDRIVVCAYDGEEIMGMAGCSEDAPHWLQIGIDVLPRYRSRGVGTYLVTLLKNKITERGDIPFYGTSIANYRSCGIALSSGFRPAWIEIGADRV